MWSVVDGAERAQWNLVPLQSVGPLRFAMSLEETAAVMSAQGFMGTASSKIRRHGRLARKASFHAEGTPPYMESVTAYCRESGELAAIAVDALCGPQVSIDGVRLIGCSPSKVTAQLHHYVQDGGMEPRISVEGDATSEELGLLVRAQRAGDFLLSRAFFVGDFQDWAYTVHDCVPTDEWDIR
ncbi:hypothetical protein ACWCOW_40490 [Streptomyces sp. NPDC001939]